MKSLEKVIELIITNVLDDLISLVKQGAKQKFKAYHIDILTGLGIRLFGSTESGQKSAVNKK